MCPCELPTSEALEGDLLQDIADSYVNMVVRLKDVAVAVQGLLADRDIFSQLDASSQVEGLRSTMKVISSNPFNVLGNAMQKSEVWKRRIEKYITVTATCKVHLKKVQGIKHTLALLESDSCPMSSVQSMVMDIGFLAEQIQEGFDTFMAQTAGVLEKFFPAKVKELASAWNAESSAALQSAIYEAGLVWPAVPVFAELLETLGKLAARQSGKQNMEVFLKLAINSIETLMKGATCEQLDEVCMAARKARGLVMPDESEAGFQEFATALWETVLQEMETRPEVSAVALRLLEEMVPWLSAKMREGVPRVQQLLVLQNDLQKLPMPKSGGSGGDTSAGGAGQKKLDYKLLGNVMRSCKVCTDLLAKGTADGLGMVELKKLVDKAQSIVDSVSFELIRDAEKDFKAAIEAAKPWAGGMGDGTLWSAKLDAQATWEDVANVATETLKKIEDGKLEKLKKDVTEARLINTRSCSARIKIKPQRLPKKKVLLGQQKAGI